MVRCWEGTNFVHGPMDFLISWVLPAVVVVVFAGIHTRLARRHRDDDDTDSTGSHGAGHGNDGPTLDHGGDGKPA